MNVSQDSSNPESRDRSGLLIAALLSAFVFGILNWPRPDGLGSLFSPLLFSDSTPSGGDMGAHVWGPAFMRDHLLPQLRFTGWTPDWYAGFPAYTYYMVVPALAIIWVNAGFAPVIGLPLAAAVMYGAGRLQSRSATFGRWVWAVAIFVAVGLVSMPYGVSFKLVSAAGLVLFPLAGWAMARWSSAAAPVPAFVALASFVFLFDTNFTIYGGNIASTLAGEFAFSLSLALVLTAIGLTCRGMDRQSGRAAAALVIALAALCHIIPIFFMVPVLGLLALARKGINRGWMAGATVILGLAPYVIAQTWVRGSILGYLASAIMLALVGAVVFVPMSRNAAVARRAGWLLLVGPVAILLAAFWLLPFVAGEPYFNDMGWERLNEIGPALLTAPMQIALPVAAVGAILSYAFWDRLGMVFTASAALFASLVANLGESALWNARLLPFFYLSVYVVAAVGVALVVRTAASVAVENFERPKRALLSSGALLGFVATLVAVAMPLRVMPGGSLSASGAGESVYRWTVFENRGESVIRSWADWNYSGYEAKPAYAEYRQVVAEMTSIGQNNDCGRAMWEYDKDLDRYGTPMALMLLPFWTDGCIGSMEGLYFESSASTPFHFLNQSMLSEAPSRAQRDLPYQGFNIDRGVDQLQVMGVRYYMALSDQARAAARSHPDLTEIGLAEPFAIFEVANTDLVEPLVYEPVVVSGRNAEEVAGSEGLPELVDRFQVGWVSQAVDYYNNPSGFTAMPAESGPPEWNRVETLSAVDPQPLEPVSISAINAETSRISFEVSEVGVPVLIKASYYPNWSVSGADGPWRVGPNLMAVIPTDSEVQLSYGRNAWEILASILTLLGLGAVGGLMLLDRGRLSLPKRALALNLGPQAKQGAQDASDLASEPDPEAEPELHTEPELQTDQPATSRDRIDEVEVEDDDAGTVVPPAPSGA